MNHHDCDEQPDPVPVVGDEDVIMRSPSSAGFGPEARAEPRSSRQGITPATTEKREPLKHRAVQKSRPLQAPDLASPSAPQLRRRASQGSLQPELSPITRFLPRGNIPLQLPSFESLGIATREPRGQSRTISASPQSHLSSSTAFPRRTSASAPSRPYHSTKSLSRNDYSSGLPLTPPEDDENVGWNPNSGIPLLEANDHRRPKPTAHMNEGRNRQDASSPEARDDSCSPPDKPSTRRPPENDGLGSSRGDRRGQRGTDSWLEDGIEAALSSLLVSKTRGEAVKIVSQTLPYPRAADKSVKLPTQNTVFCSVVQKIQERLQPGQSPYINITHAVPEQFSLSNLPTSPPSTPGLLFPGDDYFNSTVFSSATPVPAYHDFRGPIQSAHSPISIVPPHSVHVAVVERYLPPSSAQEYKDLFSPNRPSVLVDRLKELSPNGGSLLFIYPTKKGAMSFKTQYLGPILDPLLRQMVVVNELSADVGIYLGKLSSVAQMEDFETMKANLDKLCQAISTPSSRFTLEQAGKGNAHLDRNLWTEWYIQQERARMKEVLNVYWRSGQRLPVNKALAPANPLLAEKEVTSAMLLGEILEGIKKRPYGEDSEPKAGVELGVFVIRRTLLK
ncbi:hypothetical protein VTN02DRAFT_1813 [Thermoascus thermophilus]